MNDFTRNHPIAQGIFIALGLLASAAEQSFAADGISKLISVPQMKADDANAAEKQRASSGSGAASAAPPDATIQNSIASPAAAGGAQTIKAVTPQAITPGALQSLNPQPLPPGGGLIKPMQGLGMDMAKPRIDTGIKASPALIQPAVGIGGKPGAALGQAGVRPGMEDRAIIIVGGKPLTVGELKKNLFAEIAAKSGPPKTIKSSARKLDFVQPTPQSTMQRRTGGGGNSSLSIKSENVLSLPGKVTSKVSADANHVSISEMRCPDKGKGLPKISEIAGKLMPGQRVTVWGECFGDRAGRVEIIGPFPGGKLNPAFISWDQNSIELEIPNVQGASDNAAALTVVTADGKTSAAMQAQFVAARERIEVPDRLWSPNANFELSSAEDTYSNANKASHGQLAKSLRINPQCALDDMGVTVLSGNVTAIKGWEQGPPNEATVTLDWVGTCTQKNIRTDYNYVIAASGYDISFTSACRVAFQTRAWAYCPVGVAP
jgi:hypothetical protein